jgi:hypothetical protein
VGLEGARKLRELHPEIEPWAVWLVNVALAQGWSVRITSAYRSVRAQRGLYNEWLMGKRFLPVAKPGCSQHQYRLAWDMVIAEDFQGPRQKAIGSAWKEIGGSWGGSKDPVHFGVFWTPPRECRRR